MTRVYTAGPDGRCTVCERPEAEHAPEAWSERARACPPVAGCPDLDPTWPGPDGNPRGPVRCTSFPACRCGEDEDWPPTNTLRAMRLCPRCERPMVDHDDGACPEVTAETVTDEQIVQFRARMSDDAQSSKASVHISAHRMWHECNRALGECGYERSAQARAAVSSAINAHAALTSDMTLLGPGYESHPAYPAFVEAMHGKQYGREALTSAWHWFATGWTCGAAAINARAKGGAR